jgi:proteasome lid subunit RPN8/RPN11
MIRTDIRIGKPRPRKQPDRDWESDAAQCRSVDLSTMYADTMVSRIGFKPLCVQAIWDWASASIQPGESTPEVGGLLLGGYREHFGSYELLIDYFAPIQEPDEQTNVRLVVGAGFPKAIQEAEINYPGLLVMGWFHTHPGHLPYLSSTDVKRAHLFFSEPYQIAMVLDPLTDDYWTGIFSRRKNGTVHQLLDSSKWRSWREFVENNPINQL